MPQHVPAFERKIEAALHPGSFISYGVASSFVRGLKDVERELAGLVATAPDDAVALYEAFVAGCYAKAEEVDDSDGGLGEFVQDLYCGWVRARQAAAADPDETAAQLVARMAEDPYGYCHRLERSLSKVLDARGLDALLRVVRSRFDEALGLGVERDRERWRRQWAEVLRALLRHRRDLAAYCTLAEETGITAADCHAVADMLAAKGDAAEALAWVERGLALVAQGGRAASEGYELPRLKRTLLAALGRGGEVLAEAWEAYEAAPSAYRYADLMRYVPEAERATWHVRAMGAAEGGSVQSLVELFAETGELARLAECVSRSTDPELEEISHRVAEPAAQRLEGSCPQAAARLWATQGLRIVRGKRSKYNDSANADFERARRCYTAAGSGRSGSGSWRSSGRSTGASAGSCSPSRRSWRAVDRAGAPPSWRPRRRSGGEARGVTATERARPPDRSSSRHQGSRARAARIRSRSPSSSAWVLASPRGNTTC